jgi:hypothetical protein
MSKIALEGNASGTGTFTLASPNSSTDRTLDLPDASGVIDRLNRAGNVLQVVNTIKTNLFSHTGSGYQDVTDLSAVITPTSASSKILVIASVMYATANTTYGTLAGLRIQRNGTNVGTGGNNFSSGVASTPAADNGSSYATVPIMFLDSPNSTSALTYQVQISQRIGGSQTVYVNGQMSGDNSGSSTITVMEIAG